MPSVLISRGGRNDVDYKPRKKAIYITDEDLTDEEYTFDDKEEEKFFADLEAYEETISDEEGGDDKLSPEDKLMYANMAAATDKYEYAVAIQPANAPTRHAWKEEKHVDFTVTMMIQAGAPPHDPSEESTDEDKDEGETDSLLDEKNVPCPNWTSGDGFCRFGTNCKYSHDGPRAGTNESSSDESTDSNRSQDQSNSRLGQSNPKARENLNLGQSNRNFQNSIESLGKDDEMILQDEKISHLKEQVILWKIRALQKLVSSFVGSFCVNYGKKPDRFGFAKKPDPSGFRNSIKKYSLEKREKLCISRRWFQSHNPEIKVKQSSGNIDH